LKFALASPAMSEYAAVSSSSYDIESLVAKLNERAADGWDVVSVVSTGGEVSAILRRDGGGSPAAAPAAEAAPVVEAAPIVEPEPEPTPAPEPEPVSTWTPEPEPAPVVTPPVIDTPVIEAVQEPAGWGAATEIAPEPEPAPAVSPIEVSAPAAVAPVNPAPVVTTPAGWYPDPSGRFEMRYWDGTAWTEHVSRGGQQFTDPPVA
jgi:Protein of unknown function (DUF2510)